MGSNSVSNKGMLWGKVIAKITAVTFFLSVILLQPAAMARAATDVCGPVSGVWNVSGSPYIVTCDVQVQAGAGLTINAGVVVKFNAGTALRVDGTLVARQATFTSSQASPAKGNWKNIYFTTSSVDAVFDAGGSYLNGSIIQDCLIEWGGGGAGVNGAIETAGSSSFLDRNTIRNHNASGIYAVGRSTSSPVVIRDNNVSSNSKTGDGGGIYVSNGALTNNTTNGNSAKNGGGIYASNSTLTGNTVTNNTITQGSGGGIYALGSILTNNTVSGNQGAPLGGGIFANGGTLSGNIVTGNAVSYKWGLDDFYGGGIYASGSVLTNNIVSGNTITGFSGIPCHGGGIYASLSTLAGNNVSNNTVISPAGTVYGGGMYAAGGTSTSNTISGNSVVAQGASTIGYGGGLYVNGGSVINNTVNNNSTAGGSDSQGGGIFGLISTIRDNTLDGNSANRGGAIYANKGAVTNNTVTNNTTALAGAIYMNEGTASGNTLQGNAAVNGGGIFGYKATIVGNTLQSNTASQGGGIYSSDTTSVNGNTLTGNSAQSEGGGIYAVGGTVTHNALSANTTPSYGHGSGAYLSGAVDFTYNSLTGNTATGGAVGGVAVNGAAVLHYNNLYNNLPYDAEVISAGTVDAIHNYWGPVACVVIPNHIYDGNDLPGRGLMTYAPSLYAAVPLDQMAIPVNLTLQANGSAVTLSWDPLPSLPDVGCKPQGYSGAGLGYRVYYDTDGSCPPFGGQGLAEGSSPIDTANSTSITLHGLALRRYYFTVTAYDYLARQSAFANVVVKKPIEIYLPLTKR